MSKDEENVMKKLLENHQALYKVIFDIDKRIENLETGMTEVKDTVIRMLKIYQNIQTFERDLLKEKLKGDKDK